MISKRFNLPFKIKVESVVRFKQNLAMAKFIDKFNNRS